MNLLSLLLGTLGSNDSVSSVSKKTGVSSKTVSKLLMIAMPLLISYMTKNASKKEGAQSLLGALTQHKSEETVAQQVEKADTEDGAKIIGHILGQDQATVISNLAQETNLSASEVSSVLNSIAPALLNSLGTATTQVNNAQKTEAKKTEAKKTSSKKKKTSGVDLSDGFDLTDVMGLLNGASSSNSSNSVANSLLGSLLGGGTSNTSSSATSNLLGSLLGVTSQKEDPVTSMLGSLLGGGTSNTSSSAAGNLLGSLLGGTTQAKPTASQANGTELLSLLTGLLK